MKPNETDWTEGKLQFDFSGATQPVEKPDNPSQAFKSVDFVAKYPHELYLIEVKDPEATPLPHQLGAINDAIAKLQNDDLIKEHLLPKIYGTFAYLVWGNREPRGRVRYAIVIGLFSLTVAERSLLTDKVQRVIDRIGPKIRRSRYTPTVEVHTVESWNRTHTDKQIVRLP